MNYTLITPQGRIYTFFLADVARMYQQAYGGTLIEDRLYAQVYGDLLTESV